MALAGAPTGANFQLRKHCVAQQQLTYASSRLHSSVKIKRKGESGAVVWLVPFSTQNRQPRNELEQGKSHHVPIQSTSCYQHVLLPAQTTNW